MLSITSKCYCSSSIHRRRSSNIDLAVVRRITSLTSWSHNQQHSSTNIIATTKKRFYSINNDQLTLLYHRHVRINTTNNKNVTNRRLFFTNEQQSISNGSNSTTSSSNIFRRYPITFTLITFTIGITGYSIKYIHDHISGGTLEGLQRSIIFYSFGIPKYILYRYYMYMKPNNDTFWDQLNSATSSEGLDIILKLQGFYIKCGQLCASNIGNSFPIIWQNTMSILQDQCPYQDYNNVITNIIKDEYNITNISDIFEYIDPIPIGAASIGQVHRALLKVPIDYNVDKDNINSNSSRKITKFNNNNNMNKKYKTIPVVIKICYPNAERLLRGDVCTIKAFAQIAQPVHVPGIIEMEKQFATEFDYIIEGKHLQLVRTNLINASLCYNNDNNASNNGNKNTICTIPKPYLKYCTKRILIMEELHGDKLIVALRKNVNKLAKLAGYTNVEEFINDNIQQEKQHRNTSLVVDDVKSNIKERNNIQSFYRYIQLYDTIRNGLYHWTIGIIMKPFLKQNNNTDDIDWPLLNHAKLIDDLIYIHGHEVLVDGVFNSDPHPGKYITTKFVDRIHLIVSI